MAPVGNSIAPELGSYTMWFLTVLIAIGNNGGGMRQLLVNMEHPDGRLNWGGQNLPSRADPFYKQPIPVFADLYSQFNAPQCHRYHVCRTIVHATVAGTLRRLRQLAPMDYDRYEWRCQRIQNLSND